MTFVQPTQDGNDCNYTSNQPFRNPTRTAAGFSRAGLGTARADAARPMTSKKGAGFTSKGRPATSKSGVFDPLNQGKLKIKKRL